MTSDAVPDELVARLRMICLALAEAKFEESELTPDPFGVRLTALDPDGNRISLRQPGPGQSDW